MRSVLIATLLATTLLLAVPGLAAAAPDGPCPSDCEPPALCGWAPDVRKDPVGYAEFWADCAGDLLG